MFTFEYKWLIKAWKCQIMLHSSCKMEYTYSRKQWNLQWHLHLHSSSKLPTVLQNRCHMYQVHFNIKEKSVFRNHYTSNSHHPSDDLGVWLKSQKILLMTTHVLPPFNADESVIESKTNTQVPWPIPHHVHGPTNPIYLVFCLPLYRPVPLSCLRTKI